MGNRSIQIGAVILFVLGVALSGTAWADSGDELEAKSNVDETATSEDSQSAASSESQEVLRHDAYYQQGKSPVGTVLNYAVTGAAIGAIVGTGVWLMTDWSAVTVLQFAGGGIVVGSGVGLIVAFTGDDALEPEPVVHDETPSSLEWIGRDMPHTFDMPVLQIKF